MGRRVSIPVRVVRPAEDRATGSVPPGLVPQPVHEDRAGRPPAGPRPHETPVQDQGRLAQVSPAASEEVGAAPGSQPAGAPATPGTDGQDEAWRERALRAQAEMQNYRKRQQRWAQDQIEAERHRLLNAYLQLVDDLERALAASGAGDAAGLRAGLELTLRTARQFLHQEGVEPLQARHQPFDPNWHEAVATTGRNGSGLPAGTVLEVLETGYRLDGRLLRPAKVIVAA